MQRWRACGPPAISLHLNKLSIGFRELLSLLTQTVNPQLWLAVIKPCKVSAAASGEVSLDRRSRRPKSAQRRQTVSLTLTEKRPRSQSLRNPKTAQVHKDGVGFCHGRTQVTVENWSEHRVKICHVGFIQQVLRAALVRLLGVFSLGS